MWRTALAVVFVLWASGHFDLNPWVSIAALGGIAALHVAASRRSGE